jgi:maltose alpha-D-glucosyltransferase/alpha-amylase
MPPEEKITHFSLFVYFTRWHKMSIGCMQAATPCYCLRKTRSMKKVVIISIVIVLIAIGAWIAFKRVQSKPSRPDSLAGLVAAVQKERKEAGESTDIDPNVDLWYKNSVIYTLDVEVFKDSDGDGIGDFKGLVSELDYIQSLGATAIWLAPFQPTPNKDDGYDVSDYYHIDPRLGDSTNFQQFISEAGKRNLPVIMDLVVNHTSDQHPWFVQGRHQNSPFHNWYVWTKQKPANMHEGMVFPGVQQDIWTYDSVAGEYYYHRFYKFQPDLNMQNPAVEAEIKKIVEYWINQGITGFRLDGVPFFIEVPQTTGKKFQHQFQILTRLRHTVQAKKRTGIILGEANVLPEEQENFFGKNGNAMHMMFNFYVNQHLFYALATGDAQLLQEAMEKTEDVPEQAQWAQFLRNHDEVDLGRLTDKERNKVYAAFGPDSSMQLYQRGIRRRLAPMFNNNRRLLELAYSALLAMPATPVIRYGEEIGMGDNLQLKERESVRTPMQWNTKRNGGFSTAPQTVRPVIDSGVYDYHHVNVASEKADSGSLLNWLQKMIALRKSCPETGWGSWKVLKTGSSNVLAIQYHWQNQWLVTLHNFSKQLQEVRIHTDAPGHTLQSLLGSNQSSSGSGIHTISLEGYGYRWYRVNP